MIVDLIWFLFKITMFVSGAAFWGFLIWVFAGIQKSLVFTKEYKFLGYKISIVSEEKKNLTIKIVK